jgi:SOS regulatory protein LexA
MHLLTTKQEQVLNLIKDFWQKENKSPSLSELQNLLIKEGLKAKSKRSVVQYLDSLEKKGLITRNNPNRSVFLVENLKKFNDLVKIPLYGEANAGNPLVFAEDNIQGFLKVSKKLLRKIENLFALKISGDSMNKCQIDKKFIEDGDYVIVDKNNNNFFNNDIVLAIVEGCATIKKLKKTLLGEIVLLPESNNPKHQPIYIHNTDSFFLNGKVVNILKSPKNL